MVYYKCITDDRQVPRGFCIEALVPIGVVGYCWNWPRAGRADTNVHEIKIGDFEISWNLDDGEAFALSLTSVNEAGRVHTMRTVLRVVQGVDDDVEETDPYVSTGQAAEILGVSARTVARHLDAGDIPCELRGKGHRRARLSDIPAYKETRAARATELVRMREAAADGSLYDIDLSDQMLAHFADAP